VSTSALFSGAGAGMTCRAHVTMPGGVGVPTVRCTASDEGEVYMICQGTGGGYGDVLERDPEAPPKARTAELEQR
jgi:N-methylhydantoinase B/oxoprolinase/acetone carboxylase alpha subunit